MKKAPTVTSQGRNTHKANATRSAARAPILPARCIRLARALLDGPVTREQGDALAPASNSPHYFCLLRERLRLTLTLKRIKFVTADGVRSWYGRYHATPKDREIIRRYLEAVHGGEA